MERRRRQISKKMKKIITIIIPLLIIIFGLTKTNILANIKRGLSSTAQAIGDLTINWGVPSGQPIFVVTNFMPGDLEKRTVNIANGATVIRPVGVRGNKTGEIDNIAGILDFVISANGTDLYGGSSSTGAKTLSQFFIDSGVPDGLFLFNLNPNENKNVDFIVKFPSSAGNGYQNAKIVFDIQIGISVHVPAECQNIKFSKIIYGTQKNDYIKGTNGNDLIIGFEGDDNINGSNGNDCIIGGSGNDKIDASNGDDIVFGNEGNDKINGSNGKDVLFGNEGNDIIDGSNGDDTIFGGPGNDTIYAGNDTDYVEGNEGDDKMYGGNGNDTLIGGPGNDFDNGELGKDKCEAETKISCELLP